MPEPEPARNFLLGGWQGAVLILGPPCIGGELTIHCEAVDHGLGATRAIELTDTLRDIPVNIAHGLEEPDVDALIGHRPPGQLFPIAADDVDIPRTGGRTIGPAYLLILSMTIHIQHEDLVGLQWMWIRSRLDKIAVILWFRRRKDPPSEDPRTVRITLVMAVLRWP